MNKLFLLPLSVLAVNVAYANSAIPSLAIAVDYINHDGKFANNIEEKLDGVGLGISANPNKGGMWGKLEYLKNDDYDANYYEISAGGQINFLSTDSFYILGSVGLGYAAADVEGFDDSQFLTLPIGVEAGYNLTSNFSLYSGIGYKFAWDITDPTECRDGSSSSSVGQGSCSWHGGISHYNYTIGDFDGLTYKAGFRLAY